MYREMRTYSVVMLDGFRDERMDEEGQLLFGGWHFRFVSSPSILFVLAVQMEAELCTSCCLMSKVR